MVEELEFFVGRNNEISLFLQCLHDENMDKKVLFFYGEGGHGKSFLLDFLQKECCKNISGDEWQKIKNSNDIVESIREIKTEQMIPFSRLNLSVLYNKDKTLDVKSLVLDDFVKQLERYGLKFSCYRQALGRHYLNCLSDNSDERRNLVVAILEYLIGNNSLTIFNNLYELIKNRGTINEPIEPDELIESLIDCFVKDLNNQNQKIILCLDVHEQLTRNIPRTSNFKARHSIQDEWLRQIITKLGKKNVITILAGRDEPRWSRTKRYPIESNILYTHHIQAFSESEVEQLIKKLESSISPIQQAELVIHRPVLF